jgi:hypothetical protein
VILWREVTVILCSDRLMKLLDAESKSTDPLCRYILIQGCISPYSRVKSHLNEILESFAPHFLVGCYDWFVIIGNEGCS